MDIILLIQINVKELIVKNLKFHFFVLTKTNYVFSILDCVDKTVS